MLEDVSTVASLASVSTEHAVFAVQEEDLHHSLPHHDHPRHHLDHLLILQDVRKHWRVRQVLKLY